MASAGGVAPSLQPGASAHVTAYWHFIHPSVSAFLFTGSEVETHSAKVEELGPEASTRDPKASVLDFPEQRERVRVPEQTTMSCPVSHDSAVTSQLQQRAAVTCGHHQTSVMMGLAQLWDHSCQSDVNPQPHLRLRARWAALWSKDTGVEGGGSLPLLSAAQ